MRGNLYELIRGILPGCENRRDSIEKVEDFYREHILNYCYDELQIRYRDKLELNIVEDEKKRIIRIVIVMNMFVKN